MSFSIALLLFVYAIHKSQISIFLSGSEKKRRKIRKRDKKRSFLYENAKRLKQMVGWKGNMADVASFRRFKTCKCGGIFIFLFHLDLSCNLHFMGGRL